MYVFFALVSYIIGLLLFRRTLWVMIILSIALIIFLFYRFSKPWALIFLSVFLVGSGVSACIRYIEPKNNEYVGVVVDSSDNYFLFQSGIHRFYIYEKDTRYQFGDILVVKDKPQELDFITYESQFDFESYLNDKGVRYSLSSYGVEEKFINPVRIKSAKDSFLKSFDKDTKDLLDAFLFSNRNNESVTINNATSLNVVFLLSASGIYLSFFLRGLKKLFRLFFTEKLADIIPVILFTPFLIFTFPRIGIIRVFSVYTGHYISENFLGNRYSSLSITSVIALTLLMIDPTIAYQGGFFVGLSLSIFIYFLYRSVRVRHTQFKTKLYIRLFVYLFMIPLTSFANGTFHPFQQIYQFVLFPLNSIFLVTGIISLYITPFIHVLPWMGGVLSSIYSFLVNLDAIIPLGYFGDFYYFVYYVLFFIACDKYENRDYTNLVKVSNLLVAFISISFLPIRTYLTNAVYFINVGQGDATLIQNKGHAVLIDTGGNIIFDMAKETLIPFFHKRQIYYLDALVTTHDDYDHSGAAPSLIKNFPVKTYLSSVEDFPYQVGDIYLENLNTYGGVEENDTSLVFNLDFMNKKWLLTGDASKNIEQKILNDNKDIDCDILKVGHHGSNTSTSEEFLKKASPDVAIISCGKRNKYRHPHKEVIDLLNKYHVEIRRTDKEGTISFINL